MTPFHLEILSPERPFYKGECVSIVVPISDGYMGIMAHHTPLTAAIMDGEVVFTLPDGTRRSCAVTRGMLDITSNDARLLCESAVAPEEIDEERERRAMEEARHELAEQTGRRDYILSQLAFARAFNNLKVKQHNTVRNDRQ